MSPSRTSDGFGIYVHWPFCQSKCPYCDFNSHVRESVDQDRWRRALLAELEYFSQRLPDRNVTSIFFGGGTPSLMAPEVVSDVIAAVGRHWSIGTDAEITLEANPSSVDAAKFAEFRSAGINRLSLGVQALDDDALRFLGRRHTAAEALKAVALARQSFPRVSFDLIYALPGQTRADWRQSLAVALREQPEHLSVYQLTIEGGTEFGAQLRRGEMTPLDENTSAELYEDTQDILGAAGLSAYEVSNHAQPGAACRHNLTYWRYQDYAGIGPGAHGRLNSNGVKHATRQHRAPEIWLQRVERDGHATQEDLALDPDTCAREMIMMGLRLSEGIALDRVSQETRVDLGTIMDEDRLERLVAGDQLILENGWLKTTADGRLRLNSVLAYLL